MKLDSTDLDTDRKSRAIPQGHDKTTELVPPPHKPVDSTVRIAGCESTGPSARGRHTLHKEVAAASFGPGNLARGWR